MFLMLCLVSVVIMVSTIPYTVLARPCSSKDCLEVRMPLVSDNLKAPLIAELDVSTMNQQLKEYIDDSINYTFTHNVEKEDLEWKNNITGYFESVIDLKMLNLERRINEQSKASKNLTEVVREHTQKVGFTASGGRIISDNLVAFSNIKTSYGLSMHSVYTDGIYHVTNPGYYLITINIFATNDAFFFIRKNNENIVAAIVHFNGSNNGYHMASASTFVQMSSGDTVTIKGFRIGSIDGTSSMTIVRI